jgi:hypothetical protein
MIETESLWNVVLLVQNDAAGRPREFYCIQSPQKFKSHINLKYENSDNLKTLKCNQ